MEALAFLCPWRFCLIFLGEIALICSNELDTCGRCEKKERETKKTIDTAQIMQYH